MGNEWRYCEDCRINMEPILRIELIGGGCGGENVYLYLFTADKLTWKKISKTSRFWLRVFDFIMPDTIFKLMITE